MNNEEMVQEKEEKQLHFFDRLWPKRTLALILGLSMIASLIVPAAFRANREEPEETEVQSEQPQPTDAETTETPPEAASNPDVSAEPIAYHDGFLTYYELCTLAKSQGDYETALEYAEQCLAEAQTREETVTALAEKGDVLFALERYGEAKETYRQIVEWDAPDLISLYALNSKLARCQLLEGELEDSLTSCNLALEQAENDAERAEIYALRGVVLYYGGAFEEAKADFEAAIASGYEDPEILRTQIEQCEQQLAAASGAGAGTGTSTTILPPAGTQSETGLTETEAPEPTEGEQNAAIYYFGGQYAQAEEEFRKLLGQSYYYTDMQLYSNIAKCQYLQGNYAGAIESCTNGLQMQGEDERASLYTLRGSAYMAQGESALAAADFETAIEHGTPDPELNALQAAICYYFSEDYEKCIELGTPLIDKSGYEEAALWVGFSSYMLGELDDAVELFGRSVNLDQSYTRRDELFRLKARCEFQLGRFSDAISSASSGLASGSTLTEEDRDIAQELYYLRGASRLSTGQYETARDDLTAALALGGETELETLYQLTLCEFLLSDYENAAIHGETAMEIGGPTSDLCYWTGLSQFSMEQFEKARTTLLTCQELEPTKENIWFYIGVCSFSMEEYEEAIGQFSASIEADEPASGRSRYNRAICYLQREEYAKAKEDLETVVETASDDVATDAESLLSNLKSVLG